MAQVLTDKDLQEQREAERREIMAALEDYIRAHERLTQLLGLCGRNGSSQGIALALKSLGSL